MDWASLVPVGLLFILILLLVLKTQHFWRSQVKFPPGPQPLPIIGNLHIIDLKKLGETMLQVTSVVPFLRALTLRQSLTSRKGYKDLKPFEMSLLMNSAVANVIVSILLGKRFDYEDPTFKRLLSLLNENIKLFGSPSVSVIHTLYNMFPILGFFLKATKSFLQNLKEVNDFIKATFTKHLKVLDRNDQRSFIDAFLENGKANTFFDDVNLTEVVRSLFTAGMDTTATTLRWGLLLMMKYPEIQKKVQAEIDQVIGSNPPRTEHRTKMPYTDAVVHEIQRFANILPLNLPHETTVDVTVKGYFIPKGTYVIPLLNSVLQDKTQWEKPCSFHPEHFLNSEGKFVKKDAFMPFSAGRRICAGETLAKMELFLFFTSLLQRFTFQPPPGVSPSDLDLSATTRFVVAPVTHEVCAVSRS
uniref:Uncharacterized protein n=1 Tax=Pavo cristatus TaxID=9049 RepID=A0A8C9FXD6_PAVCR